MSFKWEKIGIMNVDAGLAIIGDPCYFATPDVDSHPAKTWSEFCDLLDENKFHEKGNGYLQLNHSMGHPGLGVVVSTGYGDGTYPVFIKKNNEGRVVGVMVKFD